MKKTRHNMHVEFTSKSLSQFGAACFISGLVWVVVPETMHWWPIFALFGAGIAFYLMAFWVLRFLRLE